MDAFLVSTGVVALAEIGDKTQLLAFILAAHYAAPVIVVIATTLGMLIAAVIFALLGVATLSGFGRQFGF